MEFREVLAEVCQPWWGRSNSCYSLHRHFANRNNRWHQDIKPANILVFSGSGKSGLDVYFKIADLSLCHFKPREVPEWEDSDLDAFGTQAYGRATHIPRLFSKKAH